MKTALITGATGLVGNAVLRAFHREHLRLIIASSTESISACHESIEVIPFYLDHVNGDGILSQVLERVDVVVHCAAMLPSGCDMTCPDSPGSSTEYTPALPQQ